MAERVAYNNLGKILEARIQKRLARFNPKDPRIREALTRIGIKIENETKINIRRQRLVDTGSLLNSIRYQLYSRRNKSGVVVGSFGIPYASVHEFGFNGPVSVPASAVRPHQRQINQAFGKPIDARSVQVGGYIRGAHTRNMRVRARPYLGPAVKTVRNEIREIIRSLAR
jgi:phage gpG-like protein